jgi:hypothetical protein
VESFDSTSVQHDSSSSTTTATSGRPWHQEQHSSNKDGSNHATNLTTSDHALCLAALHRLPLPAPCSLVIMGFDWIGPDFVFAALGTLYTLCGILSMREAAAGFANTGVLTVMALFVVAEGVSQTGGA